MNLSLTKNMNLSLTKNMNLNLMSLKKKDEESFKMLKMLKPGERETET
jgi:hypothetical protein